jgi:heme/copper-type cytochrome/quinol oxidase subunit 2
MMFYISFALPALGIKLDACSRQIKSKYHLFVHMPGFYFGQCSELCGPNHGFMPINIEAAAV